MPPLRTDRRVGEPATSPADAPTLRWVYLAFSFVRVLLGTFTVVTVAARGQLLSAGMLYAAGAIGMLLTVVVSMSFVPTPRSLRAVTSVCLLSGAAAAGGALLASPLALIAAAQLVFGASQSLVTVAGKARAVSIGGAELNTRIASQGASAHMVGATLAGAVVAAPTWTPAVVMAAAVCTAGVVRRIAVFCPAGVDRAAAREGVRARLRATGAQLRLAAGPLALTTMLWACAMGAALMLDALSTTAFGPANVWLPRVSYATGALLAAPLVRRLSLHSTLLAFLLVPGAGLLLDHSLPAFCAAMFAVAAVAHAMQGQIETLFADRYAGQGDGSGVVLGKAALQASGIFAGPLLGAAVTSFGATVTFCAAWAATLGAAVVWYRRVLRTGR